jgi:GGDEF domain-containing protein
MLSLKRFLNATDEATAWRRIVSLLLEKIGSAAVEGNTDEREAFRGEMSHFRESADSEESAELLFVTAGSAVQALETYNHRITAQLRKQAGELRSVVSMITETALKIGGENTRSAQRLQEIGDKFEKAGAMDDLHTLKSHLGDCLQSFREEAQRQKAESDATIQSLQQEIERRPMRGGVVEDLDQVTGLPRQSAGILALQQAAQSGKRTCVLVMVVKGVQSVNARFGFEVGDNMLRTFKENIEKQLLRADRLFRWHGPAILVLMQRPETIEQVRAQLRRMLDAHIEETFDVDGRSVLIPISAAWLVFSLTPPGALAVKQIQAFVATQGPTNGPK